MALRDILIPFIAVAVAELGDKTQVAIIGLSSETKKYLHLFFGVILAFAIVDGIAIVLGEVLRNIIPIVYVKVLSGLLFIILGLLMLVHLEKEGKSRVKLTNAFVSGFFLVLLSEWGDKSQIASGLFAAQFNPWLVFAGVMMALAVFSLVSILIGNLLMRWVRKRTIDLVAALLFIIIGISQFFSL